MIEEGGIMHAVVETPKHRADPKLMLKLMRIVENNLVSIINGIMSPSK
ncbi:MAG: hypothetical protein ACP5GZ_09245 [Vulcanisaeta sp.]